MTTDEIVEWLGLGMFSLLDDIGALQAIEAFEEDLARPEDDPKAIQDRSVRICLQLFIYGYRLGLRPQDVHPSDPSGRIEE